MLDMDVLISNGSISLICCLSTSQIFQSNTLIIEELMMAGAPNLMIAIFALDTRDYSFATRKITWTCLRPVWGGMQEGAF